MTKLVEFKNHKREILRGLFDKAKSRMGIIFIHGFERTTIESKFKNIVDNLKGKVNLFRFDFSGCGLSDGDFTNLTVEKLSAELDKAVKKFKIISGAQKISFIGHSLGCAVILEYLRTKSSFNFDKIILLAPALNQRELQKFWFVKSATPKTFVDWSNFKNYFSRLEEEYVRNLKTKIRATKEHLIKNDYFLETSAIDYQDLLQSMSRLQLSKILIIHGGLDDKVPIESNKRIPDWVHTIIVLNGDHDLQRPNMVRQYLKKVIDFLTKD